jgi:SOS-response transcriptional repressor LexA
MMMAAPSSAFEVRREARALGFRMQQVQALIERTGTRPSFGEIMRELDFYDRAGAYRVVKRLERRSA